MNSIVLPVLYGASTAKSQRMHAFVYSLSHYRIFFLYRALQRSRRGGGFGGGARRAAPAPRRPVTSTPSRPASTSTTPAPIQQPSGGGMLSGIGSTIAQGMAFGTGSAIAHRAVGAAAGVMGGGGDGEQQQPVEVAGDYQQQQMQQQQQLQGACAPDKQMFFECLQVNKGDQQACSFLYDNLQQCQRESTNMQFS